MRIVFLDFDGVLNSSEYIDWTSALFTPEQIDPRAILLVNQLLIRGRAKVVVSSSWRLVRTDEEMQAILDERGFTGEIVGVTPTLHRTRDGIPRGRGDEIRQWLDEHAGEVEGFVVLDDDGGAMQPIVHRLVLTDPTKGMRESDLEQAHPLLVRPPELPLLDAPPEWA